MADSRRLLLSLIDKLLDDVRLAAAETKSLGCVVAHICHIDNGDAQSAAVYLKERGFSGHADRLTRDVNSLLQKADEVFREPIVAEPTDDDRKQEKRYLRALGSEARRLFRFLDELRSLVDEDNDAVTVPPPPQDAFHEVREFAGTMKGGQRRLVDRIENTKVATAGGAVKTGNGKRATTDMLMVDEIQRNHEAKGWTVTQWQEKIKRSRGSIGQSKTWKKLKMFREELKAERAKDRWGRFLAGGERTRRK